MAGDQAVRVDHREIHPVDPRRRRMGEIEDDIAIGCGAVADREVAEAVAAGPAGQLIIAGAAKQIVVIGLAEQGVVAIATVEAVDARASGQKIITFHAEDVVLRG